MDGDRGDGDGTECIEITTAEFELQAVGILGDLLEHAKSLGFIETGVVQICPGENGEGTQLVAILKKPNC